MNAMTAQPAGLVRRALGGHAAIGLLASALLYIIALTGSVIVIHDRWQRWEQPSVTEMRTLSPDAAQAAIEAAMASEAGRPRTTHVYVRMPNEAMPRAVVTTDSGGRYIDGAGRIVAREDNAWTAFVVGLHEYLHLPATLGLIVVGALGVALSALAVTGVLAHPRIVRDAFRLRARSDPQLAQTDWHNRLGVWTLPFALTLAMTGAFIGLGSVGFGVLARAYTGGDLTKIYAPVFGQEPAENPAAAPLPDIATALRTLAVRVPGAAGVPGVTPTYVTVHAPGTLGQHVQILATHPRRLIYGESYMFDARGRWLGKAGMSDGALGQQAAASAYRLHFGNYGGAAIEVAYMVCGLVLCVVTATGTSIWLLKRRRRGADGGGLTACWAVVVWGVPLLLVWLAWVRALGGPTMPLAGLFWGGLAVALVAAAVWPGWVRAGRMRGALWLSVLATGAVHLVAFRPEAMGVWAMDAALILVGVVGVSRRRSKRTEGEEAGVITGSPRQSSFENAL